MSATHHKEKYSKEIIDFLPDATFVIDAAGMVIAWNRAMEEITGVPASVMIGKGNYEYAIPFYGERKPMLANLVLMPGQEVESHYNTVQRIRDTLVVDIFIPTFRPGGAYFWAKASPLYDRQGNVVGAIETIRDITERIRIEERLARSKAEPQIALEVLEQLIALCKEFAAGNYDKVNDLVQLTKEQEQPRLIADLAESFSMMILKIEAREFRLEQIIEDLEKTKKELEIAKKRLSLENIDLKNELRKLRIEIDHSQKVNDVADITETDYFKYLQKKAKDLKAGIKE
jgi:PAS domain S-box-containing protein